MNTYAASFARMRTTPITRLLLALVARRRQLGEWKVAIKIQFVLLRQVQ